MLIVIAGNIATGKTTLINQLKKMINFDVLSIDDVRRIYNKNGTMSGEKLSWDILIDQLRLGGNYILEMTGASQHFYRCLAAYPGSTLICVLHSEKETILKNISKRKNSGYTLPPMPYKFKNIDESISSIQMKIDMFNADIVGSSEEIIEMIIQII